MSPERMCSASAVISQRRSSGEKGATKAVGKSSSAPLAGKSAPIPPGKRGYKNASLSAVWQNASGHLGQTILKGQIGAQVGRNDSLVIKTAETGLFHDHIKPVMVGASVIRGKDLHRIGGILNQGYSSGNRGFENAGDSS